jgi:hypothetical protein
MPFVTFTVRRGLSATDKSRLSEAMLEAQVAAGYPRTDLFHRFLARGGICPGVRASGRKIPCSLEKIPCSSEKIPCSFEQGI